MKKILQIALFCFVVFTLIIFNKKYFPEQKKNSESYNIIDKKIDKITKNNLIKNLRYEINIDQKTNYTITSDLSEIINLDDVEFVKMKTVNAIIIDEKKNLLLIKSDDAQYNNGNYNTKFENNVLIEYMNNKIFSDYLDLDVNNNLIKIYGNVRYFGNNGTINSDLIKINLITKEIDILMNNNIKNVRVDKY